MTSPEAPRVWKASKAVVVVPGSSVVVVVGSGVVVVVVGSGVVVVEVVVVVVVVVVLVVVGEITFTRSVPVSVAPEVTNTDTDRLHSRVTKRTKGGGVWRKEQRK